MRRFLPFLAAAAALSGCATWEKHGVPIHPPRKLRVAVLPVRQDFKVGSLRSIETAPAGLKPARMPSGERDKLIREKMAGTLSWLRGRLEDRLSRSYAFEVIEDSRVLAALSRGGLDPSDLWKLKAGQAKDLARELQADLLLKSKLEGYGTIKTSWLFTLLGLDYAEGAATGWAIAAASGNAWAGIGAGALDALTDTAKWLGGAWIFNRIFIPVILEGELVSGSDGESVASKAEPEISFELFSHDKALDDYPKERRGLKQVRLRAVAEKAVDDLGGYFEEQAFKNEGALSSWWPL